MITAKDAWAITRENVNNSKNVEKILNEINEMVEAVCFRKPVIDYHFCNFDGDVSDNAKIFIIKRLEDLGYKVYFWKGRTGKIAGMTISWRGCD